MGLEGLNEIMYVKHIAEQSVFQPICSCDYVLNKAHIKKGEIASSHCALSQSPPGFNLLPLPEQGAQTGRSWMATRPLASNAEVFTLSSVFFCELLPFRLMSI